MSSAVSLPKHTLLGRLSPRKRLTSIVQILSPETENCWRERMTRENISWSISRKECCRPWRVSNPWPFGLQSEVHPTEPPRPAMILVMYINAYTQTYTHTYTHNTHTHTAIGGQTYKYSCTIKPILHTLSRRRLQIGLNYLPSCNLISKDRITK